MFIEFILIWMLAKETGMPTVFWVAYVLWVGYRIIKRMIESAPEMEE